MLTRRHIAGLTALLTVSLASTQAFADDGSATDAPATALATESVKRNEKPTEWYGYQTLGTDALALGVGALAPSTGRGFAYAGLGTYLIGAPIVHMANGNIGKGFADLGMRAALPVGAGLIGMIAGGLTAPSGDGVGGLVRMMEGGAIGLVVGVGSAIIIDAAVLARKDVTPGHEGDREPTPAPAPQAVRVLPSFAPVSGGATGGVVGTF